MNYPKKPGFNLYQSRHCAYTTYSLKTWLLKSLSLYQKMANVAWHIQKEIPGRGVFPVKNLNYCFFYFLYSISSIFFWGGGGERDVLKLKYDR